MASVERLIFSVLGEVRRVMEKDEERRGTLHYGLGFIKREMEVVNAAIKDTKEEYQGAVQETRIRQLQELVYDIEDFVDSLWEPGAYGKVLVAIGMDPRPQQLRSIEQFKATISTLTKEWTPTQSAGSSQPGGDADHGAAASPATAREEELEGIDGPKRKIVELLWSSPAEGQQLRVISIVGCRGVGKTVLARAVYNDSNVRQHFECVAWFVASGCNDATALLSRTPEEDDETQAGGTTAPAHLRAIPADKRYLVFIDDVQQAQVLIDTVDACPKNGRSRIIVTTSVHSVAAACSSGSYVYRMQCLSDDDSNRLFWRKVYGCQRRPPYSLDTDSKVILSKCGGLPLALISVAKHLSVRRNQLESSHCREVGQNLGRDYLSRNNAVSFKEMRRALAQCYDSLPDYDHRSCLLYLSIFPSGHQIRTKSLVRRLIAEGLVAKEDGRKCFDELIDRCIVEPVQTCSSSIVVKRCQVHGVLLEYIIQKSVAKNVVTLIQEHEPRLRGSTVAGRVRRLSIHQSSGRFDELADKSALRSLTMFESELFDLRSYKMLRLLDLEGCTSLDRKFLEGLCELLLLKYLSLRKTGVNKLPTQIQKLQHLETLDIRETKVEKLPMEVIMLPNLAYLFGKFQLPDVPKSKVTRTLSEFLKKKSLLHTLAGFVVNKTQGPEHVILLAGNLKKVKVWCNDTPADASTSVPVSELSSSISAAPSDSPPYRKRKLCSLGFGKTQVGSQDHDRNPCKKAEEDRSNNFDFIRLLKGRLTSLESVSIVSSGLCKDFLGSLEGPCTINSIKLRGKLDSLPDSNKLSELGQIKKLELFSTGLSSEDLSALQNLHGLEYLKLVEDCDRFCNGIFIVEKNGFESLKRLCIDAPKLPKLQFKEGAMESLTSLHLLCPNSQMQLPSETVEGISHLANLSEVILHSSMQQDWEKVANEHPNRPCVKRQPEPTATTAA